MVRAHLSRPLSLFETIRAILTDPEASYCWRPLYRTLVEPRELWLPSIDVWCNCNGWRFSGALRGYRRPGLVGRNLIRLAIACRRLPVLDPRERG